MEVSLIIPCLDEQETIGVCVDKARKTFSQEGIEAEVVVVDNGSKDASVEVASKAGARVVFQPKKGYGVDMKDISNFLKENVKGRFDHHFLNEKMPGIPTTAENIALEVARVATEWFKTQVKVRVYETPDSWVVVHDAPRVKELHPLEVS